MKFGKVEHPEKIDFTLPSDTPETEKILKQCTGDTQMYTGCAKWNRQELKNFYPRGTKDELTYYATQFNSIEMNAFFYRIFTPEQVVKWKEKVGDHFKFFPKVPQIISQFKRLKNVDQELTQYIDSISHFEEKLGMCFLQMHPSFSPKSIDSLKKFIAIWPEGIELAVELRHPDWYQDSAAFNQLCTLLEESNNTHVITDTAGHRGIIHMRLTNAKCFIRFTGTNHASDYVRIDDWVDRLVKWHKRGITSINFFVHQNIEIGSPLLIAYLNQKLNKALDANLIIPKSVDVQSKLF